MYFGELTSDLHLYKNKNVVVHVFNDINNREIEILRNLNHPFIPKIFTVFQHDNQTVLVQEKIDGCSLWEYPRNITIPKIQKKIIILNVALVIKYLHTNMTPPIIHGDISPGNIIITGDFIPYIIDFDSSFYYKKIIKNKLFYGTPNFYKPKIVDYPMEAGFDIDYYSLGQLIKYLGIYNESKEIYELYDLLINNNNYLLPQIDEIINEMKFSFGL